MKTFNQLYDVSTVLNYPSNLCGGIELHGVSLYFESCVG